ncbi:TldD/PmbA family protein [archaeon]|nr:TldD/PmbA family protein [archaeon]
MNTPERMVNYLLKLGMDDAIVQKKTCNFNLAKFSENRINTLKSGSFQGFSLFIAKDKRIFLTTIKDIKRFKEDMERIARILKVMPENKDYNGIASGRFKYKKPEQAFDKKLMSLDAADLIEKAINSALSEGARRCAGVLEYGDSEHELASSTGISRAEKGTSAYFSIRALLTKEASGHDVSVSRLLNKLNTEEAGRNAGIIARQAANPVSIEQQKYDILFSEMAFAGLLEHVGNFASAFNIEAGFSCFKGRLNKKVASPIVDINDDGLFSNGLASRAFDNEGYPSQTTKLIQKGILKTYLHNCSSAKRYNTKSTGNAGLIAPSPSNIVLKQGKAKEPLAELKNGLFITNVWYTRFNNYSTGDFSTIPRDAIFVIRNGEIAQSAKGIRISDNLLRMLGSIKAIGSRQKQVHSWEVDGAIITPQVIISDVNISKAVG